MKRNAVRLFAVLWALALAVSGISVGATAAETAVIPVEVVLEGADPSAEEQFVVEMIPESDDAPMPVGSENGRYRLKLTGNTSGYIRIPCGKIGVFQYTICQVPGTDSDCSYDDREYILTVYVTRTEQGGIDVSAVVDGQEDAKPDRVVFRNVSNAPVSVILTAEKTLDGGTPKDGAFVFRLLDEAGTVVQETQNRGRSVAFPALYFEAPGTYRYYLKEVAGDNDRILYDRAVYTAVIEVSEDRKITVSWQRNGKAYAGIPAFSNHTKGSPPKTGDSIGIYAAGLLLSSGALAILLTKRHRK